MQRRLSALEFAGRLLLCLPRKLGGFLIRSQSPFNYFYLQAQACFVGQLQQTPQLECCPTLFFLLRSYSHSLGVSYFSLLNRSRIMISLCETDILLKLENGKQA